MKTLIIAYLTLGAVILIEHRLFAYRWRHYELARRTLGIATVLFWALLLAIHGIINLYSWTIIAIAFGIAGALIGALYTNEAARQREAKSPPGHRLYWGGADGHRIPFLERWSAAPRRKRRNGLLQYTAPVRRVAWLFATGRIHRPCERCRWSTHHWRRAMGFKK